MQPCYCVGHDAAMAAKCSSVVEHLLMVHCVIESVVDTLSYFSLQPVLYDWCNKEGNVLFNDALGVI